MPRRQEQQESSSGRPVFDDDRMLREKELASWLGITTKTLRCWCFDGNFPSGTALSQRVTVWRESLVMAWYAERERQSYGTAWVTAARPLDSQNGRAPSIDDNRLVHEEEIVPWLGIAVATFRRWRCDGNFPPGVRLSERVIVWRESVIMAWLTERECQSKGDTQ